MRAHAEGVEPTLTVVVVAGFVVWVVVPGVVVELVGSVLATGRVLTPAVATPYRAPP